MTSIRCSSIQSKLLFIVIDKCDNRYKARAAPGHPAAARNFQCIRSKPGDSLFTFLGRGLNVFFASYLIAHFRVGLDILKPVIIEDAKIAFA